MLCGDCLSYLNIEHLRRLNEQYGDDVFPIDAEWSYCVEGPEKWLNCRQRLTPAEEAEDE